MRYSYIFIFLLSISSTSFAQKEGNWWYFGFGAGINFNTTPPTAVSDGQLFSHEGCSTIADENGNLLFYTDGETVWDRNHNIMPNGTGLPGSSSSAQSALIVKDHQLLGIYYIFSNSSFSPKQFSKLDMNLHNGMGDIVPGFKNILVGVGTGGERVHATLNPSNDENWIVYAEDAVFEIVSVGNGVLSSTVQSFDFSGSGSYSGDARGFVKISPDGQKLAYTAAGSTNIMVCDFDPNTGTLSNPIALSHPYTDPATSPSNIATFSPFGIEFSPDSQLLYVDLNSRTSGNGGQQNHDRRLIQYQLSGPSGWQSSPDLIFEQLGNAPERGALQLASDGRIYYARHSSNYLAVIDRPNNIGTACNFINDGFQLSAGVNGSGGLPDIPSYFHNGANPVGPRYEVNGYISVDLNANGCNSSNAAYPFSIIGVQQNQTNSQIAVDANGNYRYGVPAGQHTLTPIPENPSFWNISPSSVTVDFPTQASPFTQDFCMTAVGNKQDLEVNVIALDQGRPGFDTDYRIIVRNLGNQTTDGTVNLTFEEDYMDLISSSPAVTSQSGAQLAWDFTGLVPFAAMEFDFTMNLNTPTDPNFPLNSGDILSFTADVTGPNTDENPADNNLTLDQTVVNSYDPNDIRCIEGEDIGLVDVGEYVHYMIRFENEGTASAINVVLQNQIDLTKFDVNTLIPISSSHDFTSRISAEGMAEFTFQNINLDFNDATNDGYILYKIKTLDTLVAGDSFSNQADIFFDFNPPITTNTYTTLVQTTAGTGDVTDHTVSIYPNPATTHVEVSAEYEIERISVYDIQGRMVQSIENNRGGLSQRISLEGMGTGIYFLETKTTAGSSREKLIVR